MQDINPMPGLNPPLTITCAWLAQHGACKDQVHLFDEAFPDGMPVNREALTRAASLGLSLAWFAKRGLLPAIYADYLAERVSLLADYEAGHDLLIADYQAKRDALLSSYQAKRDALTANSKAKRPPLSDAAFRAKRDVLLAYYAATDRALHADYEARRNTLLIAALLAAGG